MKLNRRFAVAALPAAMVLLSSQALAQGMAGWVVLGGCLAPMKACTAAWAMSTALTTASSMARDGRDDRHGGTGPGPGQGPAPATLGMPSPGPWPGAAAYPAPMPGFGAPGAAPYPSPYEGMYGSMGNTYSPYYRQFHNPGMAGAGPGPVPACEDHKGRSLNRGPGATLGFLERPGPSQMRRDLSRTAGPVGAACRRDRVSRLVPMSG